MAYRSNRRGFLVLGGAALAIFALPNLWSVLRKSRQRHAHPTLAGFETLTNGTVSARQDPFVGITVPGEDRIAPVDDFDLCATLFPAPTSPGTVPVAFFTDVNCPFCRAMEAWLPELSDRITLNWHDLPLLGQSSLTAARAIGAAAVQGRAQDVRARLSRTRFQPDPAYLTTLAQSLGLDADRLLVDMRSEAVESAIGETLGLAARFGIPGTPALVIGRVLVVGARDQREVEDLIAEERANPASLPCTV